MKRPGSATAKSRPLHGCGVGLRREHYSLVTSEHPAMDWFEATSENYMDSGGRPITVLEEVRRHYPVALHGVSLSIGSADGLDRAYLERLKRLAVRIEPFAVSDHLSWGGVDGEELFDLLPLPYTEEAIAFLVARVQETQEFLGRRILLENVSSYVTYKHSVIPEWEFLAEVSRRSGCGILLDLNNIFVNSVNHGFKPSDYLRGIPASLVEQFHLAGHSDRGDFLFDTHDGSVVAPVWKLYEEALALYGRVSTLIEWDEAVPSFDRLAAEAAKAREIYLRYEETGSAPAVAPAKTPAGTAKTPTLLSVQREFKEHVKPKGHAPAEGDSSILVREGASREKRLGAYSGGYLVRVQASLAETFPATLHLLGDEAFHALASGYAAAHSARDYNLNHCGDELAAFLENWPLTRELPFLPDLARLEWALVRAYHAFDEAPLPPGRIAALDPATAESWRFRFQPSVATLVSAWPVVDLWEARKTPREKINVAVEGRPQRALVWRQGLDPRCREVSTPEVKLLASLSSGSALGDALESLTEEEAASIDFQALFASWMASGILVSCSSAITSHFRTF